MSLLSNAHTISEFNNFSDTIGLCIGLEKNEGIGTHIGILYPSEQGGDFLHLAFHCILTKDDVSSVGEQYRWFKLDVDEILIETIIGWCNLIYKRNKIKGFPYGFKNPRTSFDSNGLLKLQDNECGLSCATFVLKVLEKGGVNLLNTNSWPVADSDDVLAQQRLVKLLNMYQKSLNIPKNHIDNVNSDIGCPRIRPEQVVVAGTLPDVPVDFSRVFEPAKKIKAQLPLPQ